ncbi:DUF4114 domain-containing protein [Aquimarina sp. SS2-1]|uniref:DUF4114 domain-containing protein n=1 Tax=Aquimarina besae TaxID=3342247 RepID=UPI0036700709
MKRILLFLLLLISNLVSWSQNYNYLGTYDAEGVPDYLVENDTVTQALLDSIANALPEGFPVPDYNPHYISSGYDTDIILEEDADVWVTFVGEGAGYKNVLGFYTYDINNPPSTIPTPEEITIIFPNVSKKYSGGGLEPGNKVKIGTFSANTGIGWVLLANAWSNGTVGYGHWQLFSNPDYNPEADQALRYHNVLLSDVENERIILGFEDIRRDYGSCDNDFNDALFYVTANPFTAIKSQNFADIKSATDVSSANNGGLESNGKLANLIAKRNFKRTKNNSSQNKKKLQKKFSPNTENYKSASGINFGKYFPQTGVSGVEIPHVSSPEDLIWITNAETVFSVDYYQQDKRTAAALAIHTTESVYNHTKTICDRLNSSVLEDIRTVKVKNHEVVLTRLKRASGEREYAIHFSVKSDTNKNILYSLWNIDEYPSGEYQNFQIWGNSVPQVAHIANNVIDSLKEEKDLISYNVSERIPNLFVKKGYYENGKLHLTVINKTKVRSIHFVGNYRETELSEENTIDSTFTLTGEYEQELVINSGKLFDIGVSIGNTNSSMKDVLYLADGPWGLDYLEEGANIANFEVMQSQEDLDDSSYLIERNVRVSGEVKETVNIFRNILAGDQAKDISSYQTIEFDLKSTSDIELILVPENLANWEDRLRFTVKASDEIKNHIIRLSDFDGAKIRNLDSLRIKNIVFSIQGDYNSHKSFEAYIENVKFSNEVLSTPDLQMEIVEGTVNYPNPFSEKTTIQIPSQENEVDIVIYDMLGRAVRKSNIRTNSKNQIEVRREALLVGTYIYEINCNDGKRYINRFTVR